MTVLDGELFALLAPDNEEGGKVPAGQFGLFMVGPERAQVPVGNGILCIGAGAMGIGRMPIRVASPQGVPDEDARASLRARGARSGEPEAGEDSCSVTRESWGRTGPGGRMGRRIPRTDVRVG
ncbi:MAG: hypothetical protein GY711_03130 [bacterium]|nr:hypothetical protein [bacterium]